MEIEVNIGKKNLIFLVVLVLFFAFIVIVVAQTTVPNPGHQVYDITGGVCRSDGYGCLGCRSALMLYYTPASTSCQNPIFCATINGVYTNNFLYAPVGAYQYNLQTTPTDCLWVLCGD